MILADRYEYNPNEDKVGKGGFGMVFKAFDLKEYKIVALKFVQKSKIPDRYTLQKEIEKIKGLDHPNLIKYFDFFTREYTNVGGEADEMQVGVMEFANGGDLNNWLKFKADDREINAILLGILKGLQYLHEKQIIHRDIKPQNILLHYENNVLIPKIIDFSISKELTTDMTSVSAVMGTYEYMSPEQLNDQNPKAGVGTDIWSFGVVAYQLFTGELPFGSRFKGQSDGQIIANIINPKFHPDVHQIAAPYRQIISKCLEKNPENRFLTIGEILEILEGKQNINEETVKTKESPKQAVFAEGKKESLPQEEQVLKTKQGSFQEIKSDIKLTDSGTTHIQKVVKKKKNYVPGILFLILLLGSASFAFFLATDREFSNRVMNLISGSQGHTEENPSTDSLKKEGKEKLQADSLKFDKNNKPTEEGSEIPAELKKEGSQPEISLPENKNLKTTSNENLKKKETKALNDDEFVNVEEVKKVTASDSKSYTIIKETPQGKIAQKDGKFGFLDSRNNLIIPFVYEDFKPFNEGLAPVKSGGKWGYIDPRGRLAIPFNFSNAWPFSKGVAKVQYNKKIFYINGKGVCVRGC